MTTNSKTALITILILLIPVGLGIGGYLYIRKKKSSSESGGSKADESADNTTTSGTITGKTTTYHPNSKFPLKKNAAVKSDLVKQLQELLNERIEGLQEPSVPYYNNKAIHKLDEDGFYGDKTAAVVRYVFNDQTGSIVTEEMFKQLEAGSQTATYLYY